MNIRFLIMQTIVTLIEDEVISINDIIDLIYDDSCHHIMEIDTEHFKKLTRIFEIRKD